MLRQILRRRARIVRELFERHGGAELLRFGKCRAMFRRGEKSALRFRFCRQWLTPSRVSPLCRRETFRPSPECLAAMAESCALVGGRVADARTRAHSRRLGDALRSPREMLRRVRDRFADAPTDRVRD